MLKGVDQRDNVTSSFGFRNWLGVPRRQGLRGTIVRRRGRSETKWMSSEEREGVYSVLLRRKSETRWTRDGPYPRKCTKEVEKVFQRLYSGRILPNQNSWITLDNMEVGINKNEHKKTTLYSRFPVLKKTHIKQTTTLSS